MTQNVIVKSTEAQGPPCLETQEVVSGKEKGDQLLKLHQSTLHFFDFILLMSLCSEGEREVECNYTQFLSMRLIEEPPESSG